MKPKVAIRVDYSNELGTGHFMRALSIRNYLGKENIDSELVFGEFDDSLCERLDRDNISYKVIAGSGFEKEILFWNSIKNDYSLVLFDISHKKTWADLPGLCTLLQFLKRQNMRTAFFDGCGAEMCARKINMDIDLLIIPYECEVPQSIQSPVLNGAEYFIFGNDCREFKSQPLKDVKNVLFTFGGADPTNLSLLGLDVAQELKGSAAFENITFSIVIGPAFSPSLVRCIEEVDSVKIIKAPARLDEYIKDADIIVCATGLTKYEVLRYSKPSIHISINKELANINKSLAQKGCCIDLGEQSPDTKENLKTAIVKLVQDDLSRKVLIDNSCGVVDGKGGTRITTSLLELISLRGVGDE